jgi:signal transduction histidine kinase
MHYGLVNNISLLFVEDKPDDSKKMLNFFQSSDLDFKKIYHAVTLKETLKYLSEQNIDIVVLNLSLPDSFGAETFNAVYGKYPNIPIVLFTGMYEKAMANLLIKEGAVDYLVKETVNLEIVERTVFYNLERSRLNNELKFLNQEIKYINNILVHQIKDPLYEVAVLIHQLFPDPFNDLKEGSPEYIVNKNLSDIHKILDHVFDFSRINTEGIPVHKISLQESIEEVIQNLAPPSNVEIKLSSEFPVVHSNKYMIFQIFHNLITNAMKFVNPDKGYIEIYAQEKRSFWEFYVKDNGTGIPLEKQEMIFEVLNDPEKRDIYLRSGIGLSIVKRIVSRLKGKVGIEATDEKGTIIKFSLPKKIISTSKPGQKTLDL